nr:uncharacterized protein LOC113692000 [Coffea arabica]
MKTKDQSGVKEFFDDAYANLMNLPPSTHGAAIIEEDKKLRVEAFLLDAHENLLKGFQKEETKIRIHPQTIRYQNGTSPGEIDGEVMNGGEPSQHARQNAEPSSKTQEGAGNIIPEPPLQQGGIGNANADNKEATMNRWTDKEMEVVEIFSQGLGGDGNVNNQQDEEDLVDYSHFLFEPDPPGLF